MTWINNHRERENDDIGFVYIIINKETKRFYIGKKQLISKVTKKPLKNKRNKRHSYKESDWEDYWGSSKDLLLDIKRYGEPRFVKIILKFVKSKWMMSYVELLYQLYYNVMHHKVNTYNGIINIRLCKPSERIWNMEKISK